MYVCLYFYLCICICICIYICIYVYMFICIYVYMFICIYVYIYVYMYTKYMNYWIIYHNHSWFVVFPLYTVLYTHHFIPLYPVIFHYIPLSLQKSNIAIDNPQSRYVFQKTLHLSWISHCDVCLPEGIPFVIGWSAP